MGVRFAGTSASGVAEPLRRSVGTDAPLDVMQERTAVLIARALGEELRRIREARRLSREECVSLLPSRVVARTLLSYEHGVRQMSVVRLVELCEALEVPASLVIGQALQRARQCVQNLVLRVDLPQLLAHGTDMYRPLDRWAQNRLDTSGEFVVEVSPSGVRELAAFLGCPESELALYLARFSPDGYPTDPEVVLGSV